MWRIQALISIPAVLMVVTAGPAPTSPLRCTPLDPCERWVTTYNHEAANRDELMPSLAVDPEGERIYITGRSAQYAHTPLYNDYYTAAYDADTGAEVWSRRYDGPAARDDAPTDIAVSPVGETVYVTGVSVADGSGGDAATIAYHAATGEELWVSRYDGPAGDFDFPQAVATAPDGAWVYVTGPSPNGNGGSYMTLAMDAETGELDWVARRDAPASLGALSMDLEVTPDGRAVIVTGGLDSSSSRDFVTIAYDAAAEDPEDRGRELWSARYDNGPDRNIYTYAHSMRIAPGGDRVFVTGLSIGPDTGLDWATVAYDTADGAQLWSARETTDGQKIDNSQGLEVSPDGETVYVTGFLAGTAINDPLGLGFDLSTNGRDALTVAYDAASGDRRWTDRYNTLTNGEEGGGSLAVSPDGSELYIAGTEQAIYPGQSVLLGEGDFLLLRLDAGTGDRLSATTFDAGERQNELGQALGVAPDGRRVFVAGTTTHPETKRNFATVAYDLDRL